MICQEQTKSFQNRNIAISPVHVVADPQVPRSLRSYAKAKQDKPKRSHLATEESNICAAKGTK